MEGSPGAAPKHRKYILNPHSQSDQQLHQQRQEILTQFKTVQAGRAHMWAHLTVNIGMIFSGFPFLKEVHTTIPYTFSHKISEAY